MKRTLAISGIAAVYLLLAIATALTRRPWFDEAAFAAPAYNLVTTGSMGMSISEPRGYGAVPGKELIHVQQHVYYSMPLSHLGQAAWYELVGFSVFRMRLYHILWGLVALASWAYIVRVLLESWTPALIAALLVAVDKGFIDAAASGRPDMMSAACGTAAIAAYLALRKRRLAWAVLASQILLALSMFTHPIGMIAAFGLLVIAVRFDLRRMRWHYLLLAAAPYIVAFGLWGVYISRDPEAFRAQFGINAAGRDRDIHTPLAGIIAEVQVRFLDRMYLPSYANGMRRITVLIPLLYALTVAGLFFQRRGARILGFMAATYFLVLGVLEATKPAFYLVHITPLLACCAGVFVWWAWNAGALARLASGAVLTLLVLLQIAWMANGWRENPDRRVYQAAMAFLEQHAGRTASIIGPAELGFYFGFHSNVTDDSTLGYYSGKRAEFLVVDDNGYREAFKGYPAKDLALSRYVDRTLADDYQPIYTGPIYTIYRRR